MQQKKTKQAAAARLNSAAAARADIVHTGRLGARKKVHYVEDNMRVRAYLVASARRHLPSLAFAFGLWP